MFRPRGSSSVSQVMPLLRDCSTTSPLSLRHSTSLYHVTSHPDGSQLKNVPKGLGEENVRVLSQFGHLLPSPCWAADVVAPLPQTANHLRAKGGRCSHEEKWERGRGGNHGIGVRCKYVGPSAVVGFAVWCSMVWCSLAR